MWRGAAGSIPNPMPSGLTIPSPTFTGAAGFAAGTAAAPSIAWTADQDGSGTGFYRRAANTMAFSSDSFSAYEFGGNNFRITSNRGISWGSAANDHSSSDDTFIFRATTNSIVFGGSSQATTVARTCLNKLTTGISNAAATTVATITIPNGAHSASLRVKVKGSLGAGGAIGANEASATNTYDICIARTAGVNAVAAISSAYGAAAAAVAGAATVTCTAATAAVSGAVGATNTIDIQVTISRSGGSSTNHTCFTYIELINDNASGVTVA